LDLSATALIRHHAGCQEKLSSRSSAGHQPPEESAMGLDWIRCDAVERTTGKVSGVWVFRGTRVPVTALFENLEDGATIADFLNWFPGVTREQVVSVLKFTEASLVA
jgi:uncharacterized protein (DUF433 family)